MILRRTYLTPERFQQRVLDYLGALYVAALYEASSHPEQSMSMAAIRRHLPHEWEWEHHASVMRSLVQKGLVTCDRDVYALGRHGYRLTERGRKMVAPS